MVVLQGISMQWVVAYLCEFVLLVRTYPLGEEASQWNHQVVDVR